MRYALKFGYNGGHYSGYARQPNLRTVEGEIIGALEKSKIIENLDDVHLRVASRTDAGVSAIGNVLTLATDFREDELLSALNAHLDDIWFYGKREVPGEFNPRHARMRWYRYHLYDEGYDPENLSEAANIFLGTHDFVNFARVEKGDPQRTIDSIEVSKKTGHFAIDFRARGFLWNMVRRMVGAITKAAENKASLDDIKNTLSGEKKIDFGLASPSPLILMDVAYDFEIEIDDNELDKMNTKLEKRLRELTLESIIYNEMQGILKKRKKYVFSQTD